MSPPFVNTHHSPLALALTSAYPEALAALFSSHSPLYLSPQEDLYGYRQSAFPHLGNTVKPSALWDCPIQAPVQQWGRGRVSGPEAPGDPLFACALPLAALLICGLDEISAAVLFERVPSAGCYAQHVKFMALTITSAVLNVTRAQSQGSSHLCFSAGKLCGLTYEQMIKIRCMLCCQAQVLFVICRIIRCTDTQ